MLPIDWNTILCFEKWVHLPKSSKGTPRYDIFGDVYYFTKTKNTNDVKLIFRKIIYMSIDLTSFSIINRKKYTHPQEMSYLDAPIPDLYI